MLDLSRWYESLEARFDGYRLDRVFLALAARVGGETKLDHSFVLRIVDQFPQLHVRELILDATGAPPAQRDEIVARARSYDIEVSLARFAQRAHERDSREVWISADGTVSATVALRRAAIGTVVEECLVEIWKTHWHAIHRRSSVPTATLAR